jgi:hypothetical protein
VEFLAGKSLKETLAVIASWQGVPLNYSRIGAELNISCSSAKARLQCLVQARIAVLLPPLEGVPAENKTRKSPKLYLTKPALSLVSPKKLPGQSALTRREGRPAATPGTAGPEEVRFRGRMIRAVCRLETARNPRSTFWYYGGYGKTHVELIVQTAVKRIGFVFLQDLRLSRWCWSYCRRVFRQGIIQGAFVLYPGRRVFFAADRLVVVPADEFFRYYRRWMNACLGSSRKLLLRMARAYNSAHAQDLP